MASSYVKCILKPDEPKKCHIAKVSLWHILPTAVKAHTLLAASQEAI